jgi:hypothetical protein
MIAIYYGEATGTGTESRSRVQPRRRADSGKACEGSMRACEGSAERPEDEEDGNAQG